MYFLILNKVYFKQKNDSMWNILIRASGENDENRDAQEE